MHTIGVEESPTCPACGQRDETVQHFLLSCPAHEASRHRLGRAIGRRALCIPSLLSDPKVFPHLFQYVHETGRFPAI
ncbi:hypothetical protein DENSPDRAFT_773297 [Dentipellis sp. KUC8613]|nr:hypothetical protein DENSPDRAFT_773297 [Dentipellis sp. KUC8613]